MPAPKLTVPKKDLANSTVGNRKTGGAPRLTVPKPAETGLFAAQRAGLSASERALLTRKTGTALLDALSAKDRAVQEAPKAADRAAETATRTNAKLEELAGEIAKYQQYVNDPSGAVYGVIPDETTTARLAALTAQRDALERQQVKQRAALSAVQREEKTREYAALPQTLGWEEYVRRGAELAKKGSTQTYQREPYLAERWAQQQVNAAGAAARDLWERLNPSIPYALLSDQEARTAEYLLGRYGREELNEYLHDYLGDELARRGGEAQSKVTEALPGPLRVADTAIQAFDSGLERGVEGIVQNFSEDPLPTTANQYASGYIREGLKDAGPKVLGHSLGQVAYDALNSAGSMAPAIGASVVTGGLGAPAALAEAAGAGVTMLGSRGNAYQEAVQEGKTPREAGEYATMVGAAEAGLQYVLGGVSALGGKATGGLAQRAVQNIQHAIPRAMADLGIHALGEGAEEYLQEVLTPVFRNIAFGEDNEVRLVSEEAVYAALLGALTAGVLEGPRVIGGTVDSNKLGRGIRESGETDTLIRAALALAPESEAGKLAARMDAGKVKPTNVNLGELYLGYLREGGDPAVLVNNSNAGTEPATGNEWETDRAAERTETPGEGTTPTPTRETPEAPQRPTQPTEAPRPMPRDRVAETMQEIPPAAGPMEDEGGLNDGQRAGAGVPDGGDGRVPGPGAGEQAGGMGTGAAQTQAAPQQFRTAGDRLARFKTVQGPQISSRDLGLSRGTDIKTLRVAPEEFWDDEMVATAERVRQETGKPVTFVVGGIQVTAADGGARMVRGVWTEGGIIIQADHMAYTTGQIADHEIFHDKANQTPGLILELETRIAERYGEEEFRRVAEAYVDRLRGIIDLPEGATPDEMRAAELAILEEIFADAYAGINAFDAKAPQFQGTVNEVLEARGIARSTQTDAATARRTGPPQREPYSISEQFEDELEAWDGKSKHTFRVGTTSQALQSIGVRDQAIIWRGGKIAEIMRKHPNMTLDIIKQVPQILEHPVIVLKSKQSGSRLVLFGEVYDAGGAPVTAILELQPTGQDGQILDMNVVVSAYGKDSATARFVETSDVLYLDPDKERTKKWLQGVGLLLPSDAATLGSMGSISYNGQNVNVQGVPFSEVVRVGDPALSFEEEVGRQLMERFSLEEEPAAGKPETAPAAEDEGTAPSEAPAEADGERIRPAIWDAMWRSAGIDPEAPLSTRPPSRDDEYISHLFRDSEMTDEEYSALDAAWMEEQRRSRRLGEASMKGTDAVLRAEGRRKKLIDEWDTPKERFDGTQALRDLGIQIEHSVGMYEAAESLVENAKALYKLKRETRKAEARLEATDAEKNFAAGIAAGVYTRQDTPRSMRTYVVEELADYYWAEKSAALDKIHQRRGEISSALTVALDELLGAARPRPSGAIVLNNRTPERNMLHIFGDELGAKVNEAVFDPVAVNEAERFRFMNRMFDEVRTFEDSAGKRRKLTKAERAAAQKMIEGKAAAERIDNMKKSNVGGEAERASVLSDAAGLIAAGEDVSKVAAKLGLTYSELRLARRYALWIEVDNKIQKGDLDGTILANATDKYTQLFDQIYRAVNDFVVAHGYEPIGYQEGYAPHTHDPEEDANLIGKALRGLGLTGVNRLPTTLAGMTADYKPNKRWNPHFLTRTGNETKYDIAENFEGYIDYVSDILYHTDDIMRVRALSKYLRGFFAPDAVRERLLQANAMAEKTPEEKASFLRTNEIIDRDTAPSEADIERMTEQYIEDLYAGLEMPAKYGDLVVYLDNYANILAGKQSMADRGWEYSGGRLTLNMGNKLVRAFGRAQVAGNLSSALNQVAQLPQIQAELGTKYTVLAVKDILTGVTGADKRTEWREWRSSSDFLTGKRGVTFLVSSPGDMVISALFTPAELMDSLTSTIAVRGKYRKALAEGKTPAEAIKAADTFGKAVMGSRMKGSRPLAYSAKNPVSQMLHVFQVEAVNQWEHLTQDLPRDFRLIERTQGRAKAARALAGVIIKMLLSAFLLNRLTEELYGGTPAPFDLLGLSANFIASGEGLTTNQWLRTVMDNGWEKLTGERFFDTDPDAGKDGFDWAAAAEDTAYNVSNDVPFLRNAAGLLGLGDESLPLPDIAGGVSDIATAVKNSGPISAETASAAVGLASQLLPGGRQLSKTAQGAETIARGGRYKGYGEKERLQYPVDGDFWDVVRAMIFGNSGLPETEEFYSSGASGLSAKQTKTYHLLIQDGVDQEMAYRTIQTYRDLNNEENTTAAEKATRFAAWLDGENFTESQKQTAKEHLTFFSVVPAQAERYESFTAGGMDKDKALSLTETLAGLNPEPGYDSVTDTQRLRAIAEADLSERDRETAVGVVLGSDMTTESGGKSQFALFQEAMKDGYTMDEWMTMREAGLMTESSFRKVRICGGYDITPKEYIRYMDLLRDVDAENEDESKRNGSFDQMETAAAINGMLGLTQAQKAALWQLQNKSWKAEKNPFDPAVGAQVRARLG